LNSAAAPSSLFVIDLDGQDNWFSAIDNTSDGFFYVNLSAAISSASVVQVFIFIKVTWNLNWSFINSYK
jgi:hypothetical protein